MDRILVTPTFQSARLAGWKTGVTKLHGFLVHCVRESESRLTMRLSPEKVHLAAALAELRRASRGAERATEAKRFR